ncbi:MAG: DUF4388 domain-containing protein [Acidobacteriota bacterium]
MLEGEISQIHLIERLVELWREQFTGAIRFESDGIIKIIYFKNGDVLSASTNDRADSIDEILMRAGKVSREHVKQALARRKESETLGDAMLNLGYITRKELTWARRVQVVGVIRSIAAWAEGSFTIVADYLPKRDEGTLFPLPQVLVELIVTETDRQKFDRALSGGAVVLGKTEEFDEVFRRLGLNEDAEAIVSHVDGTLSAADVASASGKDAFNVYKLLQALVTLGILKDIETPQVTPELSFDEFASAGVADAADTWVQPPAEPGIDFDEAAAFSQPTLEVPAAAMAPLMNDKTVSAWDEPDEDDGLTQPAARMPSWNAPPPSIVAPIPVPIEPAADAGEEQWGFDEAQIETARRAAEPAEALPVAALPAQAKVKEGGRFGLLIALMVIAILAGGGYYGFLWWQKRQGSDAELVARRTVPPTTTTTAASAPTTTAGTTTSVVEGSPATTSSSAPGAMTIVPPSSTQSSTTPAAGTTTQASTAPAATSTQAPAPRPATPTTIVPTGQTVQALPAVRPRADGTRAHLDEMARQYAANPQGNFTVQVQILCDPSNLEKLTRTSGANVWFVPQTIGERACYRVFWGHYGTREEAQRGLASVPASIRDANAAIKSVPRK